MERVLGDALARTLSRQRVRELATAPRPGGSSRVGESWRRSFSTIASSRFSSRTCRSSSSSVLSINTDTKSLLSHTIRVLLSRRVCSRDAMEES